MYVPLDAKLRPATNRVEQERKLEQNVSWLKTGNVYRSSYTLKEYKVSW